MSTPLLRFEAHGHWLELAASIEQDTSLQSLGDAYVQVSLHSEGFAGYNNLWLQREQIAQFAKQLATLDRILKGEARLSSISPNELGLTVRAVSSRGNVAVLGSTGYLVRGENGY